MILAFAVIGVVCAVIAAIVVLAYGSTKIHDLWQDWRTLQRDVRDLHRDKQWTQRSLMDHDARIAKLEPQEASDEQP